MIDQDLANQMQQMIGATLAGAAMQQNIASLDNFANTALSALLEKTDVAQLSAHMIGAITDTAWQIADAMLAERKKRLERDEPPPML